MTERRPIGLTVPYREVGYKEKSKWVGLTDDELPMLAGDNGKVMELQQVRRFYKAIEAKLKEKNHG